MRDRNTTLLVLAVGAAFLLSAVASASHQHSASDPPERCPACVYASVSAIVSGTIVSHQPLRAHMVTAAACTPSFVQVIFTASERGPPLPVE